MILRDDKEDIVRRKILILRGWSISLQDRLTLVVRSVNMNTFKVELQWWLVEHFIQFRWFIFSNGSSDGNFILSCFGWIWIRIHRTCICILDWHILWNRKVTSWATYGPKISTVKFIYQFMLLRIQLKLWVRGYCKIWEPIWKSI